MTIRWIQINGSEILQLLISDRRWVECQSTTYFMQYLALLAAEGQEHMTIALEEVAPIFKDVNGILLDTVLLMMYSKEQITYQIHIYKLVITLYQGDDNFEKGI